MRKLNVFSPILTYCLVQVAGMRKLNAIYYITY